VFDTKPEKIQELDYYIEKIIAQNYIDIFDRNPDESGLQNYLEKIKKKQMTINELSTDLYNSPEFFEILKNHPEKLLLDDVPQEIKDSPIFYELIKQHPEKFDLDYIIYELSSHFEKLLSRTIDKQNLDHYILNIRKGIQTLGTAKLDISSLPEVQLVKNKEFENKAPTFHSNLVDNEILSLINSISPSHSDSDSGWYHSFKFNDIVIEDGTRTSLLYQTRIIKNLPEDLSGMSVLDIGTADGYYSFLCEYRGAEKVLAIDSGNFSGFKIAKKILDSKVEFQKLDLYDLDQIEGTFDYIICLGVYYHLPDLVSAFKKFYSKVTNKVFLSGHILREDSSIACLYDEYEMHPRDTSNWWAASPSCIQKIARRVGFSNCQLIDTYPTEYSFLKIEEDYEMLHEIGLFELTK